MSMDGKVVVITGGNAGIGKETAAELARDGASVVITARNAQRGADALADIRARSGGAVSVLPLDLASFASVRSFADELLATTSRLDVLILNAGGVLAHRTTTADGHETQFQVNHLSHFLLEQLLRERLIASAPARVVVVASDAHKSAKGGLDFDDLEADHGRYKSFRTYARTKLMNILYARELARKLVGTGVTANSLHPGFVASKFAKDGDLSWWGSLGMPLTRPFQISVEKGALTSIYCASSPEIAEVTGEYFYKCKPIQPEPWGRDDNAAALLWERSEQMVQAS
jgi:NAD(P)-dependent dehydrogenase (short-subunit alcohol dehydrogenase family)